MMSTTAFAAEPTQTPQLVKQIKAAAVAMTPAGATVALQTPPPASEPEPAPKKVTTFVNFDVVNEYLFRGFTQENSGFIAQPAIDFGIAASDSVTVNVGMFNSIHSSENTGKWYETDFYGQVAGSMGKWTPALLFTSYNYPTFDWEGRINELAGIFTYDDSESSMPLSPKITLAIELDEGKNTYLEFAIKPAKPLGDAGTFYIPVKIGLNAHDYYNDKVFNFAQVGGGVSIPLKGTKWEVHGGLDLYFRGENLSADKVTPVVTVGLSGTF